MKGITRNMTLTEIVQKLEFEAIESGGETYVRSRDIPALVDFLEEQQIRILGFEGFNHENYKLWPDIENIADFSNCSTWKESISATREYLSAVPWRRNSHFAVVI